MSCSYADGLSPYEDKGIIGVPEKFDNEDVITQKCHELSDLILKGKHVVVHTGAGISTAAGIPDFRGPNGVWTLEKKGLKPEMNISFDNAVPTKTHMALKKLVETGYVKFIVSQNIDGLHLRSGLPRHFISELHGNMFTEQCDTCDRQYIRKAATTSVGQKYVGNTCPRHKITGRICRGRLLDTILDWEANLPEFDLQLAEFHSGLADVNICLGSTLQIIPSGNLPISNKKYDGKVVIVNLQPTKHDKKADLIINSYIDVVMEKVMKYIGLEIPEYTDEIDPCRKITDTPDVPIDWTLTAFDIKDAKKMHTDLKRNKRKLNAQLKLKAKKEKKEEIME